MQILWDPARRGYEVWFEAENGAFQAVVAALKRIDTGRRAYDPATHRWFFPANELDRLREIAAEHFDAALLTHGAETVNLHTGRISQQLSLFT
jgi:hypothetical protein